ncbi:MAG TPA: nuclease A inhibitor family protein [Longimicrobium sp.]|nr:nuclease A inhibitor family protein [Longimicrobium sp.]
MAQPHPELKRELEAASAGLTYGSEADRPFSFFFLEGAGDEPPGVEAFARLLGEPPGSPAEERSLDRFFSGHTETSDPHDVQTQRIRPRYEALRELLRIRLRGATVYRLGRIEIRCYVVGGDGKGNLAGLETVAVET